VLVKTIRVLLGNYTQMIPDSIRQLVMEQQDMELVGDCRGAMKILQEAGRTKADAVILAQEGTGEPGLCSQLLAVYPDLTVLSVTTDLAYAFAQQLCPRCLAMTDVNGEDLMRVLRAAVHHPCSKDEVRGH
jgi:DNA-binding NarL/FixJ family response regulator